jgi:hypothetical protein
MGRYLVPPRAPVGFLISEVKLEQTRGPNPYLLGKEEEEDCPSEMAVFRTGVEFSQSLLTFQKYV